MKKRLICTNGTMGSTSLRNLAHGLSTKLGYKVWRSLLAKPKRDNIKYGHSVDKLTQYNWFKQNEIPGLEFTTNIEEVRQWLADGHTVFGRRLLSSSCGKGIVVIEPGTTDIVACPVYTKYRKKKREFRVHVFRDTIVAITEKRKRAGFQGERDTKIRNLANGYVFCQSVDQLPGGIRELALRAAAVSPSDFRGVDIGYNELKNELFVIEVNSAPGIQGSNLNAYIEAITNV